MATFEVEIGGKTYEIEAPDQSAAMNAVKSLAPSRKQQVQAEYDAKPWYSKAATAADDIARTALDGASFGFMDKGAAKLNSMLGGKSYEEELAAQRQATEDARTRAGWAGTAADIAGSVATGGAAAKAGLTAARVFPASIGGRTAAMAADGAAMGAASALGHDTGVGEGAAMGAAGGVAGGVLGAGISKAGEMIGGAFRKRPVVPALDDVKAARDAAYDRAGQADVIYSPQAIEGIRNRTQAAYADHGFHPTNEPGAAVVMGELERLAAGGTPVTMKGLETVRKMAGNAYNPANRSNNALLGKARDEIDALVASPAAGDVLSGDARMAADAIKEARGMHSRASKVEALQEALKKAEERTAVTGSGGNIDNAMRQEVRRWKNSERGLTPDEIAAADRAMTSGSAQNITRLIGKLSPSGNGLMAALNLVATAANPMMAIPAVAGIGAKAISDNATKRKADDLMKVLLAGGSNAAAFGAPNALERLARSKREALIHALTAGSIPASREFFAP